MSEEDDWSLPGSRRLYVGAGATLATVAAFGLGYEIGFWMGYECGAYDGAQYALDSLAELLPSWLEEPVKEGIREEMGERPDHCRENLVEERLSDE